VTLFSGDIEIDAASVEDVRVLISCTRNGSPVDPTAYPVELGLKHVITGTVTWISADWEVDSSVTPMRYWAVATVGPLTVDDIFLLRARVNTGTEVPVIIVPTRLKVI
jgi:hypothetical protein